jgi:hypothetical protein
MEIVVGEGAEVEDGVAEVVVAVDSRVRSTLVLELV